MRRREASISLVAGALILFFSLKNSAFIEPDNFKNVTESMAPYALVGAGEVMLLICGEIDLAVGSVFALAPSLVWLLSASDQYDLPIWLGVFIALLVSAGVGVLNGVVTTVFRVPSFITTLGMIYFLQGIALHITDSSQQFLPVGSTFQNIFGSQPDHYFLWLNSEFFWALALVLVVQFVLTWTRWGLHTIATGGNPLGAAETGVNIRKIKIGNFVLANVLAGFAGILDSTRITTVQPLQGGTDLMFLAVAGAVIGGTSLFGGVGTVVGGFIGVGVLIILRTGLNIIGEPPWQFFSIIGIAIIVSMIGNVQVARLRNLGRLQ
jgi:simple sugar transport system permease protein